MKTTSRTLDDELWEADHSCYEPGLNPLGEATEPIRLGVLQTYFSAMNLIEEALHAAYPIAGSNINWYMLKEGPVASVVLEEGYRHVFCSVTKPGEEFLYHC